MNPPAPTSTPRTQIAPNPAVMLILWAAFLFSCVMNAAIGFIVASDPKPGQTRGAADFFDWALVAVALVVAVIGLFWGVLRPMPQTESPVEYLQAAQLREIIRSAMYESIAIYGLVIKLHNPMSSLWLYLIAAGAFLICTQLPIILGVIERHKKLSSR